MSNSIKISTKENYETPLCEALTMDQYMLLCASLTFGETGEAGSKMNDNDQNTYYL